MHTISKMKRANRIRRRELAFVKPSITSHYFLFCVTFLLLLAICGASSDDNGSTTDSSQDNNNNNNQEDAEWYADDPYYPTNTDDYYYNHTYYATGGTNRDAYGYDYDESDLNFMTDEENETEQFVPKNAHDYLLLALAGSVSILGLASAVFCTAIFLYFLRVDGLMRRYSREGVPVDGRILASFPDIQEEMKRCRKQQAQEERRQQDRRLLSAHDGAESVLTFGEKSSPNGDGDSYSVMTDDDDSYQNSRISEYSGSMDGSMMMMMEEGGGRDQKNGGDGDAANKGGGGRETTTSSQRHNHNSVASGANSAQASSAARSRLRQSSAGSDENVANKSSSEFRRKFDSMSFRVVLEYDDITYHDVISRKSSEVVRKRLLVTGEDIVERPPANNGGNKGGGGGGPPDYIVKLHVLQKRPMSGHPRGEVRRAVGWRKRLSFNAYVLAGIALVVGGAIAARRTLPSALFYAYLGFVALQVPFQGCFLDGSFSKIISDRYVENGVRLPRKRSDDKEKMVSALKHGTSFGFSFV